jgi:hypothetical protein
MLMDILQRVGVLLMMGACVAACGDDGASPDAALPDAARADAAQPDAAPPDAAIPDAGSNPDASPQPESLRETGLYSDFDEEILAPGVREFTPAFQLWSDSAEKRRWVYLPPGSQINSSNMDYWGYPVGTRLWKEFRRDGVRVETRMLYKTRAGTGPSAWIMRTFVWNEEQTDAALVRGGLDDAGGTGHDVPSEIECLRCHGSVPDFVLGFSAVQLDHAGAGVTLDDLVKEGALSETPEGAGPPYFPLPGNQVERDALGYLHANCGTCHNDTSEVFDSGDALIQLRLLTGEMATAQGTRTFTTSVCQEMQKAIPVATQIVVPGSPETSSMFLRMNQRSNEDKMPQLGSELVDPTGTAAIQAWIEAIAACP